MPKTLIYPIQIIVLTADNFYDIVSKWIYLLGQ